MRKPLTLEEIRDWKGLVRESLNLRKDGTRFPVKLMSEIVRNLDGEPCAIITSCEDITERKALEEERRRYRDQLEEIVRERTVELTDANHKLHQEIQERKRAETALHQAKETAESASRAKSEFLANMSHELRTPLNAILGYTQILQKTKQFPPEYRNAIDTIHRSGEHLLTMITDILDLSKIEAQHMPIDMKDFHLPGVLKTIVEIGRIRADQQGIGFEFAASPDLPQGVRGDAKRLRQVLLNLIGNAIKFTRHGKVMFRVTRVAPTFATSGRTAQIQFYVEDTGIGIPPEHLEHIFAAFYQVRDDRILTEGTGLGLAISQRLTRMMGGELCVKSIVNQGSIFWFEINLVVNDSVQVDQGAFLKPQNIIGFVGEPLTVLLADDNDTNRQVIKDLLLPLGFQIVEAINGRETIQKACQTFPDVILMDLVMPVMDGLEAIQHLRALPAFQEVPILAISASVSEQRQQECLAFGCNAFLPKPLHIQDLLRMMQEQLHLEWVFEPHDRAPACAEQPLVPPSREDLADIYQLAMSGMISRLRERVNLLEAHKPELTPFSEHVRQLLKEFQIEELQRFVQHYLEESHG